MKRITKILVTSFCVAALGVSLISAGSVLSGMAEDPTWSEIELASEYLRDDTLTIPDRQITVNGNSYDSNIKLEYPNGTVSMIESGNVTLSSAGLYTIIYEATVDHKLYTEEVEVLVSNKLWSTNNPKSTIEYGTVGNASGLLVSLARNDEVKFNKAIDISGLTMEDTLIKAFINPTTVGSYEFDKLVFIFTDATDPTQTLTIRGNRSSTNNQRFASYWTSAAPEQTLGGWDPNAGYFSTTASDGIRGRHAMNASFYSQCGRYDPVDYWDASADQCAFRISYDKNDVKTYINSTWIADHDNPAYYEEEPLWSGFPSNKVFLTVQALDFSGEYANFCISELYGYDLSVENKFVETDAPEMTVHVDEKYVAYQNESYVFTPTAVVGGNYPVPEATAYDLYSGELKVNTKVYFNYNSETNRVERPIKNGTFLVNKSGKYAVVYSVSDEMGNTTEQIYWITAVKELETPLSIAVDTSDVVLSGVCGEKIALAPHSLTGGSGDINVTIKAINGETEMDVSNGLFIPEEAGTWTIEYTAKDYAGIEQVASYEISIELGTIPVFVNEPNLPKYIVAGINYTVPTVIANDYSSGTKVELLAQLALIDANGETTYNAGEVFTPQATEENPSVTLKFFVGGAEYEKTIPAVTPIEVSGANKRVYIEKMFVGENFTAERDRQGLTLFAVEDGSFSWIFANPVVADNASLSVKGIQGKSSYRGMKVTFIDSNNEDIAVTMYVDNQANGYARVLFGDTSRELLKGFGLGIDAANANPLDEFQFSYKRGKFYVDAVGVTVTKDDNGNDFNGFPSGRVYISAEAVDAKSGSGYIIKQFDNNTISNAVTDRTSPRIAVSGNYGGMYEVNSQYVLTTAIASDTLESSVSVNVTVRYPGGEIMKDVDGLLLENVSADREYLLNLTRYGQYIVEYTSQDTSSRKGSVEYAINVFDRKAPKATIAETWSATANVGETVELPEIYVSDDSSSVAEMKVFRIVRNPHGDAIAIGYDYTVKADGTVQYYKYKFTFTQVGEYRFVNVVYDATGNQRIVEYIVTVE